MSVKRSKMAKIICTHSGSFHADESLAVYMLRLLPQFKDAELVRSRAPEDWERADIVVDVSGKYDGVKFFDHHQREFDSTFSADYATKLSSAGLVYKHFGRDIIKAVVGEVSDKNLDVLYQKVYKEFIEALDANDNGVSNYPKDTPQKFSERNITLPSMVSKLNPRWNTSCTDADYDRQFAKSSALMGAAFENLVEGYGLGWLPARTIVEESFAKRFEVDASGEIMVLAQFCPWKEHLYSIEAENNAQGAIKFVLFADASGKWRVSTVSVTSTSFEFRKGLPEAWRGIRDDALSELSGIPGCIFVHAAGFIGGAQTEEAVLAMAKKGLE
ncbi:hypothetical protein DICA3_C15588 [Diutina catenulata]